MPQKINLNVAPYHDDYDPSKNFYRVLFRPGYSIQTRELTSLQSILQNQIESYGRHQFKQGDLVVPGEVGLNSRLNYVKLSSVSEVAVNENNQIVYKKYDIKNLVGQRLQGITSGVVATVIASEYATETAADTLYVKYVSSGDSNQEFTFRQGETLEVIDGVNTPLLVVGTDGNVLPTTILVTDPDTKEVSTFGSPAMGFASAVQVQEGIYFVNGFFVNNSEQLLIIDKYYDKPSAKVGFVINEEIVTPEEDPSLYDNSRGSSNYASPGAHRLKIFLDLKRYDYDAATDKNFIELLRIKSGTIQKKIKEANYTLLEETLARRTFDESGDYVVDNFPLEVREYYQKNNNLGIYSLDTENNTVNGLSESEASRKMVASVGQGKAYVKGFEIVNKETKYLEVNKSRDTITRENVSLKSSGLSEFKITNVFGSIPLNAEGGELTAYPTVYLNSVFTDGSYGLNSIGNEDNQFKTINRRGVDFAFTDTEVGALDRTDIGIKTIYVDLEDITDFDTLDNVSQLWFIKTRSDSDTVSTQGYVNVLSYSVVRRPDINNLEGKRFVEFTVYGRKDFLIDYLTEYDDAAGGGARRLYLTKNELVNNTAVGYYATIVDYNDVITPVIGITKANDFKLVNYGSGFNQDIDKVSNKGRLATGDSVYNSIFSVNYFNPVFFTKLTLDTNVTINEGFTSGKYIRGLTSGAYGVIEGKTSGFFSTKNILMVKTLFGTFVSGEPIVDEDGFSLRIAKENTISHFVVKRFGTGYGENSIVKLNGVEYNPSEVRINLSNGILNRVEITNRDKVNTEYSQPPTVQINQSGVGTVAIVEAVLFKNTVFNYSPQNVKSLYSQYGSSNSNIFTSDVEIDNTNYIESKQVTEFTFSGAVGAKYIECNGFGSDASLILLPGDFIQFADVTGEVVRGFVKYATKPEGTRKSRIYLNFILKNDVSNATVIRQRPLVSNTSSASLIFPTGGKEVSAIAKDITDTKIKYYFRRDFVTQGSSNGGNITFSAQLPFGTQKFVEFSENNYVITVLSADVNSTVSPGDIVYVNKNYVTISSATESSGALTAGSITINFPSNYFGTNLTTYPTLKLTATLEVTKAKPKLKTSVENKRIVIKSNRDLVIPLRGQDYDTESIDINSYSDVYRLRHVFEGTSTSAPSIDSNNNLIKGTDITDRFTFDDGQRDTVYDVSRLVLKPGLEAPTGQIVVVFDYFEHSQGDFCTVDSYLHEAGVTADEIGSFNSSVHGIVSLKDVFDFRPKVDNTSIVTGFQDKSYISQPNYISFSGSGGTFSSTPASDNNLPYTISFNETRYLDRIDGIFLNKKGNFIVKEGNSSLNPTKPENVDDAIPLYYLYVPSYTKTSKDVRIIPVDNKRYTMRDIGKLEKRIERLEYYTTLSILEQQTLNMQIKDDIGLDRFKTGFIVDNFESHGIGNLRSSDYRCSVDTQQSVLRPSVKEDNFELEEVYKREDQRITAGYKKSGSVITLPYTNIPLLGNSFATKTINPNPFVVLQYVGDAQISPTVDPWYDTTIAPLITENNTNLYNVFLSKDDVNEGFSSIYNSFIINWVGVDKSFYNINSFADSNTELAESTVRMADIASSSNVSPQNNEIAKGVNSNSVKQLTVSSSIKLFARSIPVKFVIRRLLPGTTINVFMEGRNVNRWVVPDIKFTGVAGNSLSAFNSPIVTDSNGNASGIILIPAGKPPRENSAWTGNPDTVSYDESAEELRFTTGNKVIRFTSSPTNESKDTVATYAEINFYATGIIPQNPASIISTKPAYFKANEGVQLVESNTDVESRPNPLAQTFKVENYDGGVFVTGIDLFFSKKSATIPIKTYITNIDSGKPGKFIVPGSESTLSPETYIRVYASGALTIKRGEQITGRNSNASGPLERVLDKNNIELSANNVGEINLDNEQVYTLVLSNHNGNTFLQNEILTIPSLIEYNNTRGTNLTLTIAKDSGKVVDLKVENVGSNYDSAIISVESPQLPGGSNCTGTVNVSNGIIYNSEVILPGSGYTEAPSIVVRGTGTGANGAVIKAEIEIDTPAVRMGVASDVVGETASVVPTRFNFAHPVYLQNNTEYAIAIETDSTDYELWASRLGEVEVVTNVNVTSQPLLGSVYRSQNIDIWTEDIFEDIKFTLYRAEFDISRPAEILLTNKNPGYEKIRINPFETYSLANSNATSDLFKNNNSIIKVNHRDHGFEDRDKSHTFFKFAEDVGGISGLSLNSALYQISNCGLDTYNIVGLTRAGSNAIGGGSKVLASYNRKFEKLYAQINYLQLPNTTIDTSVKTTNIIPVDSNTINYTSYSQSNYEKTFLNQEHFFTNQKVIVSRINQVLNGISDSLTYKLVINSSVSYLSPVIDIESATVKTTTNRIENSTGSENRYGKRYQVLKFLPVFDFIIGNITNVLPNQTIRGLTTGATGRIVKSQNNRVWVKLTSFNTFSANEPVSFDSQQTNPNNPPTISSLGPVEVEFNFTAQTTIVAFNPLDTTKKYDNKITGKVILWDPKSKELTLEVDKYPIEGDYTSRITIGSLFARTNEVDQLPDIFRVGDILYYDGISSGTEKFVEVSEVSFTNGIEYSPENGSKSSSSLAKYVTKEISLNSPSTGIDVRTTLNVKDSKNVKLLYKIKESSSEVNFDDINWEYFNVDGSPDNDIQASQINTISGQFEKQESYQEFKYSVSNLTEFTSFAVKIIMVGDDPVYVPKIQDLRIVASI